MPTVLYVEREDESFSAPIDEIAILNVDDKKLYIKNKNCLNGVTWSDNDKIKKIYLITETEMKSVRLEQLVKEVAMLQAHYVNNTMTSTLPF
ncbi:MAG: hypothetical protein J6W64_08170 [Bacilli bacterium]|nr:hypothetical protein [Bacilli bacterium]